MLRCRHGSWLPRLVVPVRLEADITSRRRLVVLARARRQEGDLPVKSASLRRLSPLAGRSRRRPLLRPPRTPPESRRRRSTSWCAKPAFPTRPCVGRSCVSWRPRQARRGAGADPGDALHARRRRHRPDARRAHRRARRQDVARMGALAAGASGDRAVRGLRRLQGRRDGGDRPRVPALSASPGVAHEIRLEEILWGGVPKDGIPALTNPALITPADAT